MRARDKRFLNDSVKEWGFVGWEIDNETEGDTGTYAYIRVNDCNNCAILDFNAQPGKQHAKRLKKLDVLISSLQDFRAAYVKAGEPTKFQY